MQPRNNKTNQVDGIRHHTCGLVVALLSKSKLGDFYMSRMFRVLAILLMFLVYLTFVAGTTSASVTLPSTQHWSSVSPWAQVYGGSAIDSTQSAPGSASSSLKFTYPSGMFNGTAPDKVWVAWTAESDELWVQYWFKYSSNFYFHSIMSKQSYYYTAGPTNTNFFVGVNGNRNIEMQFQRQDGGAGARYSSTPTIERDTWYKVTIRAIVNTTDYPTANGVIQIWVNDVKVMDYSDIRYTTSGEGDLGYGWSSMAFDPVFGGNVKESKPATDYFWIDYTIISTVPIGSSDSVKAPQPPSGITID